MKSTKDNILFLAEAARDAGYQKVYERRSSKDVINGIELILKGDYGRRILADGHNVEFEEYAKHYLEANKHRLPIQEVQILTLKYGKIEGNLKISKGSSYYTLPITKSYPEGFKIQLVNDIVEGNISRRAAARMYGIGGTDTIAKWIRQYS